MSDAILVLNAGSSSIKFSLFICTQSADEKQLSLALFLDGQIKGLYTNTQFKAKNAASDVLGEKQWESTAPLDHDKAITFLLQFLAKQAAGLNVVAVGHRVVHGGTQYAEPILLSQNIIDALKQLIPLAPLHQPHNLKLIDILAQQQPSLPQVACFDTAFHQTQSAQARAFALPTSITEKGVQRYGFHGLSYEHIAAVLPEYSPELADKKVIVLHLGNGVSLCAMHAGKSVATTMGFTALDGVPMSTRCGSIDPGVLLYLMQSMQMDAAAIEHLLYHESGLLGVSGVSSDMQTLLQSPEPAAQFAVTLFVYHAAREIGSLAAAMGGVDAVVFTAGIGENSAEIREKICMASQWLGLAFDEKANREGKACISHSNSAVSAWVIPTDEELMMAQHVVEVLHR